MTYVSDNYTSYGAPSRLRKCFAAYGIPEQILSDNGPQFISEKFSHFTKGNGIKHIKCALYHPSSNVAVERFIQTFKLALKARSDEKIPFDLKSASFLLTYLSTAHSTTGQSPASLFLGRSHRTRWDLLKPDIGRNVRSRNNLTRHTILSLHSSPIKLIIPHHYLNHHIIILLFSAYFSCVQD